MTLGQTLRLNDRRVSCLAPPLRSGAKQLEPSSLSRACVVQLEPAWCLRYAPDTKLALAYGETSSHDIVLGVELDSRCREEATYKYRNVSVVRPTRGLNRTDTALSRGTAG
jgi:hypothetical protein